MPLFKGASDWLAYRKARRATRGELRAERKARGVKRGDPIYDASQSAAAKTEGSGGFYSSEPSSRR
jgi:hypothetical protein